MMTHCPGQIYFKINNAADIKPIYKEIKELTSSIFPFASYGKEEVASLDMIDFREL